MNNSQTLTSAAPLSLNDIQDWLANSIANQLGVPADNIENDTPFSSYGLNSIQAMSIATAGKQHFGLEISPLIIWNYPTIAALSAYIAQELNLEDIETFEI
ncbi:MAG: acyl carrier protein [Cyanobacteria bacterium J06621_11]